MNNIELYVSEIEAAGEMSRKSFNIRIVDNNEFYFLFDDLIKDKGSVLGMRYRDYLKRPTPKKGLDPVPLERKDEEVAKIIASITH